MAMARSSFDYFFLRFLLLEDLRALALLVERLAEIRARGGATRGLVRLKLQGEDVGLGVVRPEGPELGGRFAALLDRGDIVLNESALIKLRLVEQGPGLDIGSKKVATLFVLEE